jgi:hypothetical protein
LSNSTCSLASVSASPIVAICSRGMPRCTSLAMTSS